MTRDTFKNNYNLNIMNEQHQYSSKKKLEQLSLI